MRLLVVWLATLCGRQILTPAKCIVRRTLMLAMVVGCVAGGLQAQVSDNLGSVGLEQMWQGQVEMPIGRGSIVSAQLWSSAKLKRQYAELTFNVESSLGSVNSRTIRVSADKLGIDGKPIGFDVAKKEAEVIATRLLGRAPGAAAVEVVSPIVFLITTTSDGAVQAFDGESGQLLWANSADVAAHPTAPASVSDEGVAVVHGLHIQLYDLMTGKLIGSRPLKFATANGVALVGTHAFVPSITGQVSCYNFAADANKQPWIQLLRGQPTGVPIGHQAPKAISAIATTKGDVMVFAVRSGVESWFAYRSKNPIVGPISFSGNGLYAGDSLGQIVKIASDRDGLPQWRVQLGQTLASPVAVFDNRAYLVTEAGYMYAMDDNDGSRLWEHPTPRIKDVLAATATRLYCRSLTDRLLVVEIKTGKIVAETGPAVIGTSVQNSLNDRLYIIAQNGRIQAMREKGADHALAKFHQPIATTPAAAGGNRAAPAAQPAMPTEPATDPFGGAGMDSGASPAPAAGTDPFGGGATDPFGAPPAAGNPPAGNPF
ncbi:MAG: PQQ-binding-like beta-propeller repeat protein [Pirellulales bacterium]